MRKAVVYLTFSILAVSAYSANPLCNHVCPECKYWMPLLKANAKELKADYLKTENRLSKRYNSKIHPALKERIELLKLHDRLMAELEALNRVIAIKMKEINLKRKNQ